MEKKSKSPSPPNSDNDEEDEEEEIQHHESPRGTTPPHSPTPTKPLNDKVPTPPPSPPKTIVPTLVAPIPPPPTSQTTTFVPPPPPVSSIPISTTPLTPPIFSQATTTTIPTTIITEPPVNFNISDMGADTEAEPPVISKPFSPSPSTDSGDTLGGDNVEFDSTYYSPYRLPTDDDEESHVSRQQLQSIVDKLDQLLASKKSYHDVVLKDFMDTAFEQWCFVEIRNSKTRGEGAHATQPKVTVKTEPKGSKASGSSNQDKKKGLDDDSDEKEETIVEALKRKKRDKELDETLQVAKEAEERERKNKAEQDAINCKKALFPLWTRETLIKEAIEFPSMYWLEPVASFDCENSRDSQFDMPITRKTFKFHCFDSTVPVPFPHPKVDRELIDFYLKFGQP
ncbi:uncharacterized protein LOC111900825 [Lactuca sativa]|uniref:uncharacterized protein LOC111900825 n=1 Tax=Lactuca sativa TaxID=4236 RepID=UPI000CD9B7E9|nr:uncharacterized protein LOC111900825 [Lactuca sativa]